MLSVGSGFCRNLGDLIDCAGAEKVVFGTDNLETVTNQISFGL